MLAKYFQQLFFQFAVSSDIGSGGAVEAKAHPIQAIKNNTMYTKSTTGIITAQSLIVFPKKTMSWGDKKISQKYPIMPNKAKERNNTPRILSLNIFLPQA